MKFFKKTIQTFHLLVITIIISQSNYSICQTNNLTNTNSQLQSFPTLTFPTEIVSHDPNRNFFKDYINNQDIGKNLINNPYNVGDELIIKNVDTIVKRINKNLLLLSNDLANIRKSLPNSEKKLNTLQSARNKIQNTQENIYLNNHQYDFYKLLNPKKASRILKNYSSAMLFENPNYNIYLYKKPKSSNSFSYYCRFVYIDVPAHDGCIEIKQDEWEKLERKLLIEKVEDNLKRDFLFGNYGTTEKEYLDFELFNLLKIDSINYSKNKQDIFGYTYIGQIENGVRSGFGTLVNLFQDTIYKGIWKDDMPYQGQFYQFNYENRCFGNCENGIGLKITNGCVYRGSFKDSKRDGNGEYIFKPTYDKLTNNYMISTFANGKEGIDRKNYTLNALKLENKNVVVNRFYNGDLYIKSKQVDEAGYQKVLRIYNSGQIFSGSCNFEDDIKKGVVYFQNGYIFLGSDQISSDNIDGEGIFITLNSDGTFNTYMGEFVDGKINGFGTVTYASGKVNDGLFENGKFIKSYDQIAQEKIEEEKRISDEKLLSQKTKDENKMMPNDFDPSKVKWNYVKNTTRKCNGCPNNIQCSKRSKDDIAAETDLSSWLVLPSAKVRYGLAKSFGMPDPYLINVNLYECPEFCSNQCKYYYNLNRERGY